MILGLGILDNAQQRWFRDSLWSVVGHLIGQLFAVCYFVERFETTYKMNALSKIDMQYGVVVWNFIF